MALAATACAPRPTPVVQAADPWCRATPAGAPSAACYVTLTASADERLTGAASPVAANLDVHSMSMDGGVMRMRQLEALDLPGDRPVALAPGGLHLMLIAPTKALTAGDTVTLTLRFGKAAPLTLQAPVRDASEPGEDVHALHDPHAGHGDHGTAP
ncbi:copper chaperone PCu(A)C [Phenylobacterium sp.]|uniref:copper chaperone PCu(A)C n=1 Tax=Phenylobacterium sp. TaxID=1871053 RepID=UPI003D2D3643